ncbi:MAG: dynamin family protein [Desulfococcaceae bacterium]|jgi:GTPase Era involved in 16S rRNA processing|nr:dynamin family protein [Desulfococcaceae bacterium]
MAEGISIAVVGTTSGGKSSFLNALCGRFILPVGVQETTYCINELIHIPNNIIVSIKNKDISPDETYFASDADARTHIQMLFEKIYTSFNKKGSVTKNTVHLSFLSDFLRIFTDRLPDCSPEILSRVRVFPRIDGKKIPLKIIDLPGYRYEGDDNNLDIILNGIEDALIIIFLINAEETDSVKEDRLFKEILQYQQKKGMTWENIYFVLNRCDALFRDRNDVTILHKKLKKLQERLRTGISEIFGISSRENIVPVIQPLSAMPVMYGETLFWNFQRLTREEKEYLLSKSCLLTNQFLPDDLCDDLPRSPKKWNYEDIQHYRNGIVKQCFYTDFLSSLESHIMRVWQKSDILQPDSIL